MKARSKIFWACGILVLLIIGRPLIGHLLTPNYASRASLERQFAGQISRLAEVAGDPKGQWNTSVEIREADKRLFGEPAILEAYIEPTPGSHLIVGDKHFDWSSETSVPVINFGTKVRMERLWYITKNGYRVDAVAYTSERTDRAAQPVAFTLIVDINQLRAKRLAVGLERRASPQS